MALLFFPFFFGGGGEKNVLKEEKRQRGLIFSPAAMATIQWIYMAAIFDVPYWN